PNALHNPSITIGESLVWLLMRNSPPDRQDESHQQNISDDNKQRREHDRTGRRPSHTFCASPCAHSLKTGNQSDDEAEDHCLECRRNKIARRSLDGACRPRSNPCSIHGERLREPAKLTRNVHASSTSQASVARLSTT